MPLVTTNEMLKKAQEGHYAVGAFNVENLERVMAVIKAAGAAKAVIVIEEHTTIGGLGSMVCQVIAANIPRKVVCMGLPDAPVVTGTSREVFDYYHLNCDGIVAAAKQLLG